MRGTSAVVAVAFCECAGEFFGAVENGSTILSKRKKFKDAREHDSCFWKGILSTLNYKFCLKNRFGKVFCVKICFRIQLSTRLNIDFETHKKVERK
jgi:hypothetical protein